MKRNPKADPRWRSIAVDTPVSIPGWLKLIARLNRMARNWGWSLCLLLPTVALATNPVNAEPLVERVDCIDRNHFYDDCGRLVFCQIIFKEWHPHEGTHRVIAWRMQKDESLVPYRDWQRGGYSVLWLDGELLRLVSAATYDETWTQYDPELIDREWLPRERRRELLQPPKEQP